MTANIVAALIRGIAGVYVQRDLPASGVPRIYFANHSSHLDFAVIWATLPPDLRRRTRPVAAADYWTATAMRRALANRLFRAVLIPREGIRKDNNPLDIMATALGSGADLIIFPEGTRSLDGVLRPFKSGMYHLVKRFPACSLVPVYLENLNRLLPKGEFMPVPVMGRVTYGPEISPVLNGEGKAEFLDRAHRALRALSPCATGVSDTPQLAKDDV